MLMLRYKQDTSSQRRSQCSIPAIRFNHCPFSRPGREMGVSEN